jgi:Protein of unknown function (DUF1566)
MCRPLFILLLLVLLSTHRTLMSFAATTIVPQTGQTSCWDASGASISCPGTGQDGALRAGLAWPDPRFSDNGDLTVTDKLTGLVWNKDANPVGVKNWQQSLDYIKSLNSQNYHGKRDWRLPNINELRMPNSETCRHG